MLLGELIVFYFPRNLCFKKTLNSELTSLDNFVMKTFSFRLLMLVLVVNVSGLIAQVYASHYAATGSGQRSVIPEAAGCKFNCLIVAAGAGRYITNG